MQGRYNKANIMIDEIDEVTRNQIQTFLNHPAFGNTYIAIMPDCHAGKGAVIGFTMKLNDYVIPNIIGVDIGCGMLTAKYPIPGRIDLKALDTFIHKYVPSGFSINNNIAYTNSIDKELSEQVDQICSEIGIETKKSLRAIGSLGGGNHFIEAGYDAENNLVITIHSGSRNFGKRIADFYQKKAKDTLEKYFITDPMYKDLEFLCIESDDAMNYLVSLGVAQDFASANRKEIMYRISQHLNMCPTEIIESIHNFIDSDQIIRKGATPAKKGQKVIIPFNMADGIAICEGKGSAKYNYSAPHGAGRILSRTKAKETLSLVDFDNQMKAAGIYTTTVNKNTLDEAPSAYKDKNIIINNIKETVEVIEFIRPVYNFKAGEE
jgi:RNA-splicing ligase RtcB